jgi:hypothetical protein
MNTDGLHLHQSCSENGHQDNMLVSHQPPAQGYKPTPNLSNFQPPLLYKKKP